MRLLVVEDNEQLARLLVKGLEAAGFDVEVSPTAGEAAETLASARYAAVVLDLGLPDDDGIAVLRALRARGDATPVLILTARSALQDRVKGLQSGADDYLPKPFAFEELVARLHALLRRPSDLLSQSLCLGNVAFETETRQVLVSGEPLFFSARESALLEILLRRAGRVVPKTLVEDHLFGLSAAVSSNAVEVYVHRLRKQLADAAAKVRIHTIRGVGYLIAEEK